MTDSNYTLSCLYNLMVSDTFNRQVIKQGAISANIENYSLQFYDLDAKGTMNLTVSNFLFLKSSGAVSLTGDATENVSGLYIAQTSGAITVINPNDEAVSLELAIC